MSSSTSTTTAVPASARSLHIDGLDDVVGFQLRQAQHALSREFTAWFHAFDITPVQYSVLLLISKNPGGRQADFAAALGLHQPNLATKIEPLVARELVSRVQDPADRRANALRLTQIGRRFLGRLQRAHEEYTGRLRSILGDEDYDHLIASIRKLNAANMS